ncbi:iron(III) transport system permease protein [Pollutimonas bauzanensis]|uniref:Iron(III) transport system permease protein n=2 Tax=Pollutimonas bauzanensis TaxID=658167 RepID=A0A1M5X9T4_9BURK|nr:iron(III) transport system permease protein [Pollutimonas bauzanensis]
MAAIMDLRSGRPWLHLDFLKTGLVLLALVLGLLIVLPMAWLVYYSFIDQDGGLTLGNYGLLVTDTTLLRPFLRTLGIAVSVGLLCCIVATPLAWLAARTDLPGRRILRMLVMASFVTPPFLGAIAWEILAAPNTGLVNELFRHLAGQQRNEHLVNIYTIQGLTFVMTCYTFPYVFTLVANGLDRIPSDLEDASSILGGGMTTTLRRITIPLVLPALLAGALIAILQTVTAFGEPAILALPAGFHVATTKIWSLFQYPPKPELAAAASMPLFLIAILLLQGKSWILGRKGYTIQGGKSGQARITPLGKWKPVAMAYAALILSLAIVLPYFALFKTALTRLVSDPLTFENLTLEHFRFVFLEYSPTQLAMWNTFSLGILTATVGTFIALMTAYMVSRSPVRGSAALGVLATIPIAVPSIVLGVGIFLAYSQPELRLYGTRWILLLAFLTIAMPAAYQQVHAAFQGVHVELEEASRILGSGRLQTLRRITAPLIRTSVIATWCFVFVSTIRELSASILLTTANTNLVSVMIYNLNENGNGLGPISVLGIVLLGVSVTVIALVNRLPGHRSMQLRQI